MGLSGAVLELLMSLAICARPFEIALHHPFSENLAYCMKLETFQIIPSLPSEAISNRPKLLHWLLEKVSPTIADMLLDVLTHEIEDRPWALRQRFIFPSRRRKEEVLQ